MNGSYRRFEVRQDAPAPPVSPPPAEISNISKGDPSNTLPSAMETFPACPSHMQDGLSGQRVGTTGGGEGGAAQTSRETPTSAARSTPAPRGDAAEWHAADPPPAKVANPANLSTGIGTGSNLDRSAQLNTSAAGTLPEKAIPLEELEPAHYWSETLQADFWVCATAAHADAFRTEGQVAYLPDEIWLLRELKGRDPVTFPAKLRAIHQAKRAFGAVIASLEQVAERVMSPARPSAPGACYACGTRRRWRSRSGVLICGTCHPPADVALVAAWTGAA